MVQKVKSSLLPLSEKHWKHLFPFETCFFFVYFWQACLKHQPRSLKILKVVRWNLKRFPYLNRTLWSQSIIFEFDEKT